MRSLIFNHIPLETVVGIKNVSLFNNQTTAQFALGTISDFVVRHPSKRPRQLWIEYVYHPFREDDRKVVCLGVYEDMDLIAKRNGLRDTIETHVRFNQRLITKYVLTDERSLPQVVQPTIYKKRGFSNLIRVSANADYVSLCLALSLIAGKHTGNLYLTNDIDSEITLWSCKIYGSTAAERAVYCLYIIDSLRLEGEIYIISNKKEARK